MGAKGGGSINVDTVVSNESYEMTRKQVTRDEDGEMANTRGLDNQTLLQQQRNMLDKQDQQLDKIGNVVDQIRYENQNFANELKIQDKMLDKVNDELDENNANMIKLDTKLKGMLAKGSICKLWVVLIIEIIVLIFLCSCL